MGETTNVHDVRFDDPVMELALVEAIGVRAKKRNKVVEYMGMGDVHSVMLGYGCKEQYIGRGASRNCIVAWELAKVATARLLNMDVSVRNKEIVDREAGSTCGDEVLAISNVKHDDATAGEVEFVRKQANAKQTNKRNSICEE